MPLSERCISSWKEREWTQHV